MKKANIIYKDFFENNIANNIIDLIVTDPPYKCFGNKLKGENLSISKMIEEFLRILKSNGQIIIFCNFKLLSDLIFEFKKRNIPLQHLIIWDKRPTRSWIAWSYPLRHVEYVLFAGYGKLDFKTGIEKEAYKRSSFGGALKKTKPNKNKKSYEMFQEIWDIKIVSKKKRIHPTQKPIEFSKRFEIITKKMNLSNILDPFAGSGALLKAFNPLISSGYEITTDYKDL